MRSLYTLLIWLFSPLIFLGIVWRYGLKRTLKGLPERFGGEEGEPGMVWFHAASVGEVRAVEPLLRALPGAFPGLRFGLTTTTVAGKDLAAGLALAAEVRMAPLDFPACVGRFLDRRKPRALLFVETELWPNWIHAAAKRGVPLALLNGRLSDKSLPWYLALKFFWKPLLRRFTKIAAQSPQYAERFLRLGAAPAVVSSAGNLKYDVPAPDPSARPALLRKYGFEENDRVVVFGSVHADEAEGLLDAFAALAAGRPTLKLVLAPRRVERAPEMWRAAANRGFAAANRSLGPAPGARVLVLDTIGELTEAYGLAVAAFVGGSLVPHGGQNPLEPARWGVPVLFGPHMENFREMAGGFVSQGGAVRVQDARDLAVRLAALLDDESLRGETGRAARRAADAHRGAVENTLRLIGELLDR